MTNGIHFRVVVKSTCLNNMYHYRYQERTPNIIFGGGLGGVSGLRVCLRVAGSGMGRLCLGERLGVSTALCPPG